jgi:hypothetical protein
MSNSYQRILFEKMITKEQPSWSIERAKDGGYRHSIVEQRWAGFKMCLSKNIHRS